MKRYLTVAQALVLGLLLCSVLGISSAQEETEFSWGRVRSVSSNQIVVTEYDYDKDEEVEATYSVEPNVKLYNVNSLQDIAIGNDVWIDYIIREGARVVISIEVKQPSDEEEKEEGPPEETYEGESESYSGEPEN